jgi:hypothetical protein
MTISVTRAALRVASLCLLATALFANISLCAELVKVGAVSRVKGTATVVRAVDDEVLSLTAGSGVYAGDVINTSERSRVKLLMVDDTILTLGQSAELRIDEYDYIPGEQRRSSVVSLKSGNLKSLISKTFTNVGSKFEVHTLTAVSGARGTTNIVSVIDPSLTLVIGSDGETGVRNIDASVVGEVGLMPGFGTYVERGKLPTEPFPVTDELLEPLERDTYIGRTPTMPQDDGDDYVVPEAASPGAINPMAPEPPADGMNEPVEPTGGGHYGGHPEF